LDSSLNSNSPLPLIDKMKQFDELKIQIERY